MFDIDQVSKIKKGDMLIVRDFHVMSANNGEELSAEISNVNHWEHSGFSLYGFEFEIEEDMEFMILVRLIKGEDGYVANDVRMMRQWDSSLQGEFDGISIFKEKGVVVEDDDISFDEEDDEEVEDDIPDSMEIDFKNFKIIHAGEEDEGELPYAIKKPYPFWDVRTSKGETVALCEYGAVSTEDDDIPDNYWAKTALVEWYAYVGDSGTDGLVTFWFGWDLGLEDLDVLKK